MDTKTLNNLLDISKTLAENRLLEPLLKYAMNIAIQLVNAERGFLILLRPDGGLDYRVHQDWSGNEIENPDKEISHTIVRSVIEKRMPRMISNAMNDSEFRQSDSVISFSLRSVLCVPLVSSIRTLGAIYLENRSKENVFRTEDLPPLEMFAAQAAVSIENALLNDSLEERIRERNEELLRVNAELRKENAERRKMEEQLKLLSIFDTLTGLFNRRYFFEQAEQEDNRSLRYQHDMALIMVDIDHFKAVNDHYGHLVGDQVLKTLATLCRSLVREVDLLARFGGEEFVFLLPETNLEQACVAAERLRSNVEKATFVTNAGEIKVTISAGVASRQPGKKLSMDDLLDQSDKALYRSKQAGRNRITAWRDALSDR